MTLRNDQGDIVGTYEYEHQAVSAARLQVSGTYTLTRPPATLTAGTDTVIVIPTVPADPSGLVVTPLSPTVLVPSWTDNSDNEDNFVVERSIDGVTGWAVVFTGAPMSTSFPDINLNPETTYYYRAAATNAEGSSGYTSVVSGTTPAVGTVSPPSTDIPTLVRAEIESTFTILPQDVNGWTIYEPTPNTMVYYIDPINGDDATASPYASNAFPNMKEPTLVGLSTYKNLDAAWNGQSGDVWFLLKGGADHTFEGVTRGIPSGLSPTVRAVVAGYDVANSGMPRISRFLNSYMRYWKGTNNSALIGIDFDNEQRDPDHAAFLGWGNTSGVVVGGVGAYGIPGGEENVTNLIEGCRFNYCSLGLHYNLDTVVRRCTLLNHYSETSHAQGCYGARSNVLFEENILDHTGWWDSGEGPGNAAATIFNHNTYLSDSDHVLFRGNIFSRPSSIGTKFTANPAAATPIADSVDSIEASHILLEDNFYFDCEVGASLGGNDDRGTGARWEHIYVLNNFFADIGYSQQTNRTLGWGIEIKDWDTGVFSGNVLTGHDNDNVTNTYGLLVAGHVSDVSANGNVFYDLGSKAAATTTKSVIFRQATVDPSYTFSNANPMTNVSFDGNYIQNPTSLTELLETTCDSGVSYTSNTFYSTAPDTGAAFEELGVDMDFAAWNSSVGGTNSLAVVTFADPTRNAASYMGSIGLTATKQAFLDAIRAQSMTNWDPQLTGKPVVDYLRAGFVPV